MSMRLQIWLIFLAPPVFLAALYLLGLSIPVPHLGRDYVVRVALPEAGDPVGLPTIHGPPDRSRPLVVIDPGHGGKDPGASVEGYREKDIALALAMALRDRLVADGGVRVALTREDDRFLVLDERPEIARRLDADLFVSIHADSAGEASGASGASIYTLSARASSEAAARFAERENEADRVNGVRIEGQDADVSAILVELSQRRVQEASAEFAGLIVREGEGELVFHPRPRRSAALAVLRAPDVPAVLYEAGFITNPEDARRLASPEARERFAGVMARAIRIYFARQAGT
ncbi:N-acetylmuramoyl-L-alanine amidase family protein [Pelagerythrobacter marinus]|uniref:N-acetylmuramoyl-L-alanine amidase family protein n=1 Tax=Pelagerythrobacter marinus TaxID=538382 RepID=UPI0020373AE2|nr:N-acetylmuramoyl-L-alanine amidase [Pelagerythrobacter marinus]USA38313.1 N-acetylmuramoyl-L-alanine amidase [Pelagerythrobacter marinus]WPZ07725.1 N-acetylmuramoyl-L-alanine amidase [Pelagerythrobacter marinus]